MAIIGTLILNFVGPRCLQGVYLFLLIIAILFSYGVSIYITRSLSEIGKKIKQTRLDKTNNKIQIENGTVEDDEKRKKFEEMIRCKRDLYYVMKFKEDCWLPE